MPTDFGAVVAESARTAGVSLAKVPIVPAMGDLQNRITEWEAMKFATPLSLKAIEVSFWDKWDTALRTLKNLEVQIGSIAPRQRSILAGALHNRRPEAFPYRSGTHACQPSDGGYCKTGEPGPYWFEQEFLDNPSAKGDLEYLATVVWPGMLAKAVAEEGAAIIVQRARELSPLPPSAGLEMPFLGSPPGYVPPAGGVEPPLGVTKKQSIGAGVFLGGLAALAVAVLLSRRR